jgi:putative acetyltransferase
MDIAIRPFDDTDSAGVRQLFVTVNRLLAPPPMREAFEAYIARAVTEEIDRIPAYYQERGGGFWVAAGDRPLVGMFGLERAGPGCFELRRMYVDPAARRNGVAWAMLRFAEDEARRRGADKIELSTSELQSAAIALYNRARYQLVRDAVTTDASHKTIGGGIRRFQFEKAL